MFQFMELRAQGRFGRVWKAKLENDEVVAVKVFPLQEKQSWFAEHEVYRLPRMSHENILKFIGIDRKGEALDREFYLMTEFHPKGKRILYVMLLVTIANSSFLLQALCTTT